MAAPPTGSALAKELVDLLNYQKSLHRTANSRRGQTAKNKASRAALLDQFTDSNAWRMAQKVTGHSEVRTTVVGYAYSPCTIPLARLKPIAINELRLEMHHRGRVLIIKTFGEPLRFQAVQNAIEDHLGEVDRLAVYNFEKSLKPTEVLPRGAVFAVKEPYYKVTADGGVQVRVDHPSDLVRMAEDDARVPLGLQPKLRELCEDDSAEHSKAKGNEAFKVKDFHGAVKAYSRGLKVTGSGSQYMTNKKDLLRNRAIAHINLGRYEAGLEDAQEAVVMTGRGQDQVFEKSKNNAKAFYRAGCAAYHLRKFQLAKSEFQKVLECTPYDADAIRELVRTERRLREQESGTYNFEEMIKCVKRKQHRLDHADYDSKVVKKESKTGGNGLFATETIEAGELVLCEKAFTVAYKDEEGGEIALIANMNRDTGSMGTHTTRLVSVVHKLMHNPKQAEIFFQLYDGGYTPQSAIKLVDGVVPVDTFQVQATLEINGFGCPETASVLGGVEKADKQTLHMDTATGVWITASFANHDCIGNAQRSFIGDMMVIRATRTIEKDEEIFMLYRNDDNDHEEFQKQLVRSWGFRCQCILCIAEGKTSEHHRKHRIDLFTKVEEFLRGNRVKFTPPAKSLMAKAEKLWKRLDQSYDDKAFTRGIPRRGLRGLAHWLCMAHMLHGSSRSTIQDWATRCLQSQGILISMVDHKLIVDRKLSQHDDTGVHAATYLASVYQDQDTAIATQLECLASELYQIRYGSMHGYNGTSRI